jgi:hypothetical protein
MNQEIDDDSIHWNKMIDKVRQSVIRALPFKPDPTPEDKNIMKLENLLVKAKIAMLRNAYEPNYLRGLAQLVTRERYLFYLEGLICKN